MNKRESTQNCEDVSRVVIDLICTAQPNKYIHT